MFGRDKTVFAFLFCEKNTDQMVRTQNWAVLYEVVKVIHDNSNKEVEDKEATDEDESGEEEVGEVRSTACAGISFIWVWITGSCLGREQLGLIWGGSEWPVLQNRQAWSLASLPRLPSERGAAAPENQNHCLAKNRCSHLRECLEIVVPVYHWALSRLNFPKHLNGEKELNQWQMFLTCMPTTP